MAGRILVADDHPLTREGITMAAIAAIPGATVVGVGTIAQAAAAIPSRPAFRLIVLDFHLPDAHGYSGFLKLQHLDPAIPIVIVTAREDPSLVEAARALGAAGFVFKSLPLDEIAAVFRRVILGGTHFAPSDRTAPATLAARGKIAGLSPAQHGVLMALADGRSNKEIARDLAVTEATVKAHMTAIFRKLGVRNRTQALLAVRPLFSAGEIGSIA